MCHNKKVGGCRKSSDICKVCVKVIKLTSLWEYLTFASVYSTSVVRLLKFMGFQTTASYTGTLGHIFAVGAYADHCSGLPRGKVCSLGMSPGIQNWSMTSATEAGLLCS